MNILVAPDSFKDSLSASEVSRNISEAISAVIPSASIRQIPISDGGEGLLEALITPLQGTLVSVSVKDPLHRTIEASYGLVDQGKTAIIDFCNYIDIPTNFFDAVKGESDTVAGLILELAGEFPTVQQVVKYKQFSFTALDIQKNRIHKVQSIITPITSISQENV